MTPMRVAMQAPASRSKDCGCGGGCGETPSRCCGLECLVRPNFYCGQLLNDTDLSSLVQWSRDRLALSRYRDGWGVVCGLEVMCSAPDGADSRTGCGCSSAKGTHLWIDAGYAVDCCGNDLVVCEPIPVDLSAVCRPDDDPCADPCEPVVVRDPRKVEDRGKDDTMDIEGMRVNRRDLIVVDLALRYSEQPSSGQRPMFRGNCADVTACEPTRMRECAVPVLTVRDVDVFTRDTSRDDYEKRLLQQIKDMTARIARVLEGDDKEKLIQRLSGWRTYGICLLVDWARAQDAITDDVRRTLGGWMFLDWLMHVIRCHCTTCRTDDGVPLARLVLWRKDGRTECCRPLIIIPRAPWRRELSRDCNPVPTAGKDLLRWLGKLEGEAKVGLEREGMELRRAVPLDTLHTTESSVFSASADDVLHLRTIRDWLGDERVIAFGLE